jgi:hypothetical protein
LDGHLVARPNLEAKKENDEDVEYFIHV